jgi:hypothetical protein
MTFDPASLNYSLRKQFIGKPYVVETGWMDAPVDDAMERLNVLVEGFNEAAKQSRESL